MGQIEYLWEAIHLSCFKWIKFSKLFLWWPKAKSVTWLIVSEANVLIFFFSLLSQSILGTKHVAISSSLQLYPYLRLLELWVPSDLHYIDCAVHVIGPVFTLDLAYCFSREF